MATDNIGNFFFELGAEELPAGQILNISNHIKDNLHSLLSANEVKFSEITVLYTPRRLFFNITQLELDSKDKVVEIKGPPQRISEKEDGSLSEAALGFAKKNNIAAENLFIKEGYLWAKQTIKARSAKALLEEKIPEIIAATQGTRFMRWAYGSLKFARPLQWILACIVDSQSKKEILNIEIEGIKASDKSYGHRFLGPKEFTFNTKEEYISQLEELGVLVCPEKRRNKILEESQKLAQSVGGTLVTDDKLLDEVILITENPSPILCEFDKSFLSIPDCVLQTVMIHHQRYLPIVKEGKSLPYFIAVSNNPKPEAKANIKSGNEKVIVPRFKDAEFFVTEDAKTSLKARVEKLEKLGFMKGSMKQKVFRLQKIAKFIIDDLKPYYEGNPEKKAGDSLDEKSIQDILEGALLSKSDLSSSLVFEFTELQGEIGGIYAEKEGLSSTIASTISEHYKPRFAGDSAPKSIGSKIVSIADKVDNIVAAFALGKIPTSSADPFALRRQANGILEITLHSHLILNLDALIDYVIKLQQEEFGEGEIVTKIKGRGDKREEVQVSELNWAGCDKEVKEFLNSRLSFVFEIFHKDTTINKAILSHGNPLLDLNKRHMMLHFLYTARDHKAYADFITAACRITNITRIENNESQLDTNLFETDYEKNLYNSLSVFEAIKKQNISYSPVLNVEEVLAITKTINLFFDNVLVNVDDIKLKNNRKALLSSGAQFLNEIADFSLLRQNKVSAVV